MNINLAQKITTSGNDFDEMNEELCVAGIEWLYAEADESVMIRLPAMYCNDESFVQINEDERSNI